MVNEQKFKLALGKRKGKAMDAARLVLCFGLDQRVASETIGVSQQAVSVAVKDISTRVARYEAAFNKLCEGVSLHGDAKTAQNAFNEALSVALSS